MVNDFEAGLMEFLLQYRIGRWCSGVGQQAVWLFSEVLLFLRRDSGHRYTAFDGLMTGLRLRIRSCGVRLFWRSEWPSLSPWSTVR